MDGAQGLDGRLDGVVGGQLAPCGLSDAEATVGAEIHCRLFVKSKLKSNLSCLAVRGFHEVENLEVFCQTDPGSR